MLFVHVSGKPRGNFSKKTRHVVLLIGQVCTLKDQIYWKSEEPFSHNAAHHYKNKPIQIYWKLYHQKNVNFQIKNSDIFHISAQNIDCGYSLELPWWGGSDKYPQSMFCQGSSNEYPQSKFLSTNKKNNVYPCKPQFYYRTVGFKGSKLYSMFSWWLS